MKAILGQKLGMTQIFDDEARAIPVTVVKAGPVHVVQVKTMERDGYNAIQYCSASSSSGAERSRSVVASEQVSGSIRFVIGSTSDAAISPISRRN